MDREQIVKAWEYEASVGKEVGLKRDFLNYISIPLVNATLALIKELTEENKKLEYTLAGVMHSVDKWLDGKELEQDEVNRAITMREKTLQIVEKLTEENERLSAELEQRPPKLIITKLLKKENENV